MGKESTPRTVETMGIHCLLDMYRGIIRNQDFLAGAISGFRHHPQSDPGDPGGFRRHLSRRNSKTEAALGCGGAPAKGAVRVRAQRLGLRLGLLHFAEGR